MTARVSNVFHDICFRIKLRIFALRLLNQTKSRMYSNLSDEQYNQLGDSTAFADRKDSSSTKEISVSQQQRQVKADIQSNTPPPPPFLVVQPPDLAYS